jgi:hypothetical protein
VQIGIDVAMKTLKWLGKIGKRKKKLVSRG